MQIKHLKELDSLSLNLRCLICFLSLLIGLTAWLSRVLPPPMLSMDLPKDEWSMQKSSSSEDYVT